MEAPIIAIESITLVPGYHTKHTLDVDLGQSQYAELVAEMSTALINFMNEDGRYGNLDAGEYVVRFSPLRVDVLVK